MSKHLNQSIFYNLPSGIKVHPCRLIQRDGTLMWKHACLYNNVAALPTEEAQRAAHNKNCSAPRGAEQLGVPRT